MASKLAKKPAAPASAVDAPLPPPITPAERAALLTRLWELQVRSLIATHEAGEATAATIAAGQRFLDSEGVNAESIKRATTMGGLDPALKGSLPFFDDDDNTGDK